MMTSNEARRKETAIEFVILVAVVMLVATLAYAMGKAQQWDKPWKDAVDANGNPLACYPQDSQHFICVPKEER